MRRRRLAAASAASALALAGSALWWSTSQPLELPTGACWSVLDRADLQPLAGRASGTFALRYPYDGSHQELRPDSHDQVCRVEQDKLALLEVRLNSLGDFGYRDTYAPEASWPVQPPPRRLDLGADVQGWMDTDGTVRLALRCDNELYTTLDRPYLEVQVWGDFRLTDPSLPQVHQARLSIALKTARAAVAQYPCRNPVHFPDRL